MTLDEIRTFCLGLARWASHVGRFGWVDLDIEALDPSIVREVVAGAWRRTAPKATVAAFDTANGDER